MGAGAHGVVVARGTLSASPDDDGTEVVLVGGEPASLQSTMAVDALVEGQPVAAPDEIVLDRSAGYDIGDQAPTRSTPRGGGRAHQRHDGPRRPAARVRRARYCAGPGVPESSRWCRACSSTTPPAAAPPGTVVRSADQVADDALGPLTDAIASVDLVRALLWLVTGVIIGAVVFLSAMERQRDFAILRAMGTPTRTLLVSVATQAVLIALIAAVVAIVLQRLLVPLFPLEVRVPARAMWQIPLGAVVVALVAGAVTLRRVASTDPATAFAGPGA